MARIVVIAPGRGSYNRTELGYLSRGDQAQRQALLRRADALRTKAGRIPISELDGAKTYQPQLHLPGENASSLIYTCAAADYLQLTDKHDVVAVLGNSMGWYTTLFTSGCLGFDEAFSVVDTMGQAQQGQLIGGQVIYPVVNDDWTANEERQHQVNQVLDEINRQGPANWVGLSIRLGGFLVLAGTDSGVKQLLQHLPAVKLGANDYPFQLAKHAAFHTPLMADASRFGFSNLSHIQFQQPKVPMIDGRGAIWRPHQSDPEALRQYTFHTQVRETYDFTSAVRVAIREYNPDHLVLLGPGETLGGSIAQVMIAEKWRGIADRESFIAAQKTAAKPLIAMNRPDQAEILL